MLRRGLPHMIPHARAPDECVGQKRFDLVGHAYEYVGLIKNQKKGIRRQFHETFWGGDVDGIRGVSCAPIACVMALCLITISVIDLGFASVALLQVLAGSWVSVLVYRRRWRCWI